MGQVRDSLPQGARPANLPRSWILQLRPSCWLQAISFGLTQYDVEELMEYSGHKCIAWRNQCCVGSPTSTSSPAFLAVTQSEIEGLYKRFRALDRGRKVLHCA